MEIVTISGYQDVPSNDEQSLIKALAHQPVSVAIDASDRDFQFYSGVSLLNTCVFGVYDVMPCEYFS